MSKARESSGWQLVYALVIAPFMGILLYKTFNGCCREFGVLAFNYIYTFTCIFIAFALFVMLVKRLWSSERDFSEESVGTTIIKVLTSVIVGVILFIILPLAFQEAIARQFGFDPTNWSTVRSFSSRSRVSTIAEVRSGAGLALLSWGIIGLLWFRSHSARTQKHKPSVLEDRR